MWPRIARNVVCPLHERMLGRRTFAELDAIEESQWASPDEIRALQTEKLRELLRTAQQHTGFYKARLADIGADVDADAPVDVLARLPLLSKSDIRKQRAEMIWAAAPGGLHPYNTGGSTGTPLQFVLDRRRQACDAAARIRTHRWFGADIGDRELYLWGSPVEVGRTNRVRRIRDWLFNHRLLSAFSMSPERMDAYLDEIERFKPRCLFGYPSGLAQLAAHARRRGRSLSTRRLRAVFVTGEVCYPHDRDAIRACFDVPIANGYGSREGGFIAHECPAGRMHITAEHVIVEVCRDGRPVPPGETGELVITHLDAYAMPFIRYQTGDVGRLRSGRCPCGRGLPMIDVVEGRSTDFLYLPDGSMKHALSVVYPLRGLQGVERFRVTQDRHYAVTVEVVPDRRDPRIVKEAVGRCVGAVLGRDVPVRVSLVADIAASGSGKYRYVVSHAAGSAGRSIEPCP